MGISPYLAMTAAEISSCRQLPEKIAYMACHFSPYTTGLSNLPSTLPADSVMILNDRTPIHGHDPKQILYELTELIEFLSCSALLLDFQRADNPESDQLCKAIYQEFQDFMVISHHYAKDLDCPILLPPCPLNEPLEEYILPWNSRPIWLEIAPETLQITIDRNQSRFVSLPDCGNIAFPHHHEKLHCRYRMDVRDSDVTFILTRTKEDILRYIANAQALGIRHCIGLWQELQNFIHENPPVE